LIIWRQLAFGMTSDFIQHSAEIEQAPHLLEGTTETKISYAKHDLPNLSGVIGKLLTVIHNPCKAIFWPPFPWCL
jgi:hypothetical protein